MQADQTSVSIAAHPATALFAGEKSVPVIASCEHYAGSEKLMVKALQLQQDYGPVFDVTCDCEDGAAAGEEQKHAHMAASLINSAANRHGMVGARIHDPSSPFWRDDIDILIGEAGESLAYLTLPKVGSTGDASRMIDYIEQRRAAVGLHRDIPIHILIETHGALRDVFGIAALPGLQVLDFGLMDFVSGHQGAIPFSAMRSPEQFEHGLVVRAKCDIVAAALSYGVVPAHNVSLSIRDPAATGQDAHRARHEFGFLRMWSVHPGQIMPIVTAMRPASSEVQKASDILLAASDVAWGPISHENELHDRATYRYFWTVLQRARASGLPLRQEIIDRFFS
ncbi:aldolase/citrate lyase family protein [Glaciimonas sp. Gout2]|uniref:HpcH/HpaI aldolase/citrate lyase family protein n=1 Tax=unclassified Glaciimonas TaxID=2644401 RepID=UPI002B235C41|nr:MULTISPECIES: aldolase/citrate lyase family protein [unclassified Glaciimonas]MEB0010929.1 aldolase/citrate lyase family protein [Glaciimonas sp. Cout2]MEB0081711.1 aldolase/citrate lyase family protein [Glaciimonas sp. Gout2]